MALLVEEVAVARLFPAAFAWRDAGDDAFFLQRSPEPVGVVATVGKKGSRRLAPVSSLICPADSTRQPGRPVAAQIACRVEFTPPCVRPRPRGTAPC